MFLNFILKKEEEEKMKRLSSIVILLVLTLFVFSGITYAGGQDEVKIMFVNPFPSHPFWATVSQGANDAGKELTKIGVKFSETGSDEGYQNPSRLVSLIEIAIAEKYDAIIAHPFIAETFEPVIDKAVDAGIYFICVADDAPKSKRSLALTTDDVNAGRGAAQALLDFMGDQEVNVAIISNIPGVIQLERRMKGFKEVIDASERANVVTTEYAHNDNTLIMSITQNALAAHPEINAFFGVGAENGPFAAKAIKELGREKEVTVVAFDDMPDTIDLIKEGIICATVVQRQYLWGYGSVKLAYRLATGEKFANKVIDTGYLVVTKENVDSFSEQTKDKSVFK